jgi:hypothetical protein
MASFATIQHTTTVPAQAKEAENTLQKQEEQKAMEQSASGFYGGVAAPGFSMPRTGADFSGIPTHPSLQTGLSVQCCAKDGKPCSCPKCKKASGNAASAVEETAQTPGIVEKRAVAAPLETAHAAPLTQPTSIPQQTTIPDVHATRQQSSEAQEITAAQPATALIVDDTSADLSEGQMTKTEFLQQLRSQISSTLDPVLERAGQTTEGCPYLNYWLDLYQQKDAEQVEATVRRYAPDSATARTANEYISTVAQRALRAAEIWVRTGRLSGVPEGVPVTLPGQNMAAGVNGGGGGNRIMRKAKSRGKEQPQNANAIQQDLGEGQPMDANVCSRMESAFGTSFSNVRTHTDANAVQLSDRVNARAFTVGNHVAFGGGEYKPGTLLGEALIAHELAHVVQQRGSSGEVANMQSGDAGYDALEHDADKTATSVIASLFGGIKAGVGGLAEKAMPQLRSGLRIQRCNTCPSTNPTGEVTASNGWGSGNEATSHLWRQRLQPFGTNFQGCEVTEADPGGGTDSCWFAGSSFGPFNAITGGTWTVESNNYWGDDHVGWYTPAVTYYRAQGRAPCTATFPQSMRVVRPSGNVEYTRHMLSATIGTTTVSSTRQGHTETKNWP